MWATPRHSQVGCLPRVCCEGAAALVGGKVRSWVFIREVVVSHRVSSQGRIIELRSQINWCSLEKQNRSGQKSCSVGSGLGPSYITHALPSTNHPRSQKIDVLFLRSVSNGGGVFGEEGIEFWDKLLETADLRYPLPA